MAIMNKIRKALATLSAFLALTTAAFALPLTGADIARMVQQCPTLDDYEGSSAVIWDRKELYTQDSQRRTVKSVSYVILCEPTARFGWLTDQLVAPAGGRIELEQASFFDPITASLLQQVSYDANELKNGRIVLSIPRIDDLSVFVLSYRLIFPKPDFVEDVVYLATEYPTWEGSVQIRLPRDTELFWENSSGDEPTTDVDDNFRRYGWFYFKQPATRGVVGMVESSDPYIVFSTERGPASAIDMLNDLSSRSWSSIPASYASTSSASQVENDLATVGNFWRSPLRLSGAGTWRSADMIPAGGPWTTWEAIYLVADWLTKRGWKAEVWAQHLRTQERDSISCAPGLQHPVLRLTEPQGKRSYYYTPSQFGMPSDGKTPMSLRGKTVYHQGARRLQKHSFSGSRMEKNRLSLNWNLSVDDECNVTGALDMRVRYSWVEMFEALAEGDREVIYSLLEGIYGWLDPEQQPEVRPLGSQGFRIIIPVKARSGIEDARGLMVGLPSVMPGHLVRLFNLESNAVLKFPFVIEQSYTVKLPSGYRLLSVPIKQEQASMVNSYTRQYRLNNRRNVIEGEEKLIQNTTHVDAEDLAGMKRVLNVWGTWHTSNLALVPTRRNAATRSE